MTSNLGMKGFRDVNVGGREYVRRAFNDADFEAKVMQGLSDFKADEATPHDCNVPAPVLGQKGFDPVEVRDGV